MKRKDVIGKSYNFTEEINRQLDEEFGFEISDPKKFSTSIVNMYYTKKYINVFIFNNLNQPDQNITEPNTTLILCINSKETSIEDEVESIRNEISKTKTEIIKELASANIKNTNKYCFLFVNTHFGNGILIENFKSMKTSETINHELSWVKDMTEILNQNVITSSSRIAQKNVKVSFIYAEFIKSVENFEINISSRVKSAKAKGLDEFDVSGQVFTASLYSISKLYSHIGDELYQHNLRKHINGRINGVDFNINQTLKDTPERFWYFNNGITLLVDAKHINYDDPEVIQLNNVGEEYSDNLLYPISIINGAQTVSVANNYFSKLNLNDEDKDKLKASKENAEVILRVVSYDSSSKDQEKVSEWVDEISVSLNRQKPIKSEDMVYNHRLISAVNKVKDEKFGFEILRRGYSPSVANHKYNLIEVMKLFRAYLDSQPGMAKNGSGSLIEIDDTRVEVEIELDKKGETVKTGSTKEENTVRINILLADSLSIERRQKIFKTEVFDQNYKPVNYLMKLLEKLKEIKRLSESEEFKLNDYINKKPSLNSNDLTEFDFEAAESIRKYGEYHIIDAVTQYELKKNGPHFRDWGKGSKDAEREFTKDKLKDMIIAYSFAWKKYLNEVSENSINDESSADDKKTKENIEKIDYTINQFKKNISEESHKKIISEYIKFMEKL